MKNVKAKILKIAMGLVGLNLFTACYGTAGIPYVCMDVKGKVTDEHGTPIGGIRITHRGTVLGETGADGGFTLEDFLFTRDSTHIQFHDVDGEANGGKFKDQYHVLDGCATEMQDEKVVMFRD